MEIYARFLDINTLKPIIVSKIFLQIISTYNHKYWKTTLMKQNLSELHIAIGTAEMRDENYIIKISDHKEMTSFGFNKVKVKKTKRFFSNKNRVKLQMI